MGGEQHGDIESWTGGAWYDNMKETYWGHETWWWNDEAKEAIRAKKEVKKKCDAPGRQDERDIYRQANKEANKEVARSRAPAMDEVYKEVETPEGERNIYRIAKARDKSANDFTQIRQIKD